MTEEVAAVMPEIESSGFSNNQLTRDVYERLAELQGDGLVDEISEGLATSGLVSAAIIAGRAVRGNQISGTQRRSFLIDAGIGASTAAVLDILLLPIVS